jgi:hypothetical protein
MSEFNVLQTLVEDDEPVNEPVVQMLLDRMRRKLPIGAAVIARWKDGRVFVVDGRSRIEAAPVWHQDNRLLRDRGGVARDRKATRDAPGHQPHAAVVQLNESTARPPSLRQ